MASSLLIDDNPLQVLPKLAEKIGLNEAIILQQLHYWLNRSDNRRDGEKWVYNSYTGWKEQFPFWGIRTIQRAFLNLENLGLIKVNNYNKMKGDLTKWYTIDYAGVTALETSTLLREKLTATSDTPSCQNGTMPSRQNGTTMMPDWRDHDAKMTRPIPETTTEITPKTNSMQAAKTVLPVKGKEPTENIKIADYFAQSINSHKDALSSIDYQAINKLVAEGFTLERCKPGIDDAVKGIRSRPGGVVRSFKVCEKAIRQLDPTNQPLSIQNYQPGQPRQKTQAELDREADLKRWQMERRQQMPWLYENNPQPQTVLA